MDEPTGSDLDEPSEPVVLMSGLVLGESPRWHDDRLWVCDWAAREIMTVDVTGRRELVMTVASFPFSIDWLPTGELLIASAAERRLLRRASDGTVRTQAELSTVSEFPWNEIVVDGRGNTYLNQIGYDMMGGEPPGLGSIALVTRDGEVREVAGDLRFPNGMAVTPDDSTLIVAESHGARLTAFDIDADGDLHNRRVWAELPGGAPDGICLDADGAVWFGDVPNRRCVRVREGGDVLQVIDLDRGCFACMLGGPDGMTLFMVAAHWRGPAAVNDGGTGQVLTARAPSPGAGWP